MNWDQSTWDSGTWDQPSDYFSPQPKPRSKMKRQDYYPSRIGDQVNWLDNYAAKLPIHGAVLGVIAADITASVNDAKYGNYVLGTWLSAVRNFSPSTTDAVDDVLTGSGTGAMVLPTFTAPALPAGVTAALPGTLNRIFALIAKNPPACSICQRSGISGTLNKSNRCGDEKPLFHEAHTQSPHHPATHAAGILDC